MSTKEQDIKQRISVDSFKIIADLAGSYSSTVQLIQDPSGKQYVLKTVESVADRVREVNFQQELGRLELPSLTIYESQTIQGNQFILEYLENSTTLGNAHNLELYFKFGQYLRILHQQKYGSLYSLGADGSKITIEWDTFVQDAINYSQAKMDKVSTLPVTTKEKIVKKLSSLKKVQPNYSVIHGDLHTNNVLIQGGEVYLFDSGSDVFVGDYRYDYCRLASGFPNIFGNIVDDSVHSDDKLIWDSFCDGYGITINKVPDFNIFLLLSCTEKINNIHTPYMTKLVDKILENA